MLLCNIGTHVDPSILIKRIDDRMEIPGLRDSLVKIMTDFGIQVGLTIEISNFFLGDYVIYN